VLPYAFVKTEASPRGDREPGRDAPLNHAPGAVVTLMERSNVSTVMCAGQIKKWRGGIIGYDIPKLRAELDASRDYVFAAAGIARDLFRA
jgi:5-methylthioadenosine/S-adenosylhomocysteine deaminase